MATRHRRRQPPRNHCSTWVLFAILVVSPSLTIAAEPEPRRVRVAAYNVSLYGQSEGQIRRRLADGHDRQAEDIARVVQSVRPDVLVINELDFDAGGEAAKLLAEKFFAVGRDGGDPIDFSYLLAVPSNTGVDSGFDLSGDGKLGQPEDAWGYGKFEGQYAIAVFSRFPIDEASIRSFQRYRWKDLPNAQRPVFPDSGRSFYSDDVWAKLRLSSKNHVDIPIQIGNSTLHLLASHPTPPVFDGPEDRNGCRNHDEIRFWIDYLKGQDATYLVDDRGTAGGLPAGASFVCLGDLNSDPWDGDSRQAAIRGLLAHPRLHDPQPRSPGAAEEGPGAAEEASGAAERASGAAEEAAPRQAGHVGPGSAGLTDVAVHTADFGRGRNLRVDYVLPSVTLKVLGSGVHWPLKSDPAYDPIDSSDHRLVWVDVELPKSDRP